jgi:hypothetical protein
MIVEDKPNLSRVGSVNPFADEGARRETVSIMTLDTLLRKYKVPLRGITLRWDIEGYEYELVSGNLDFFRKLRHAAIIMEFHSYYLGPEKSVRFLTMLEKAGFRLHQVVSCEPLYFLHLPGSLRRLARKLFAWQFDGPELGLHTEMDDHGVSQAGIFRDPSNALYHYPNLHLYLVKD